MRNKSNKLIKVVKLMPVFIMLSLIIIYFLYFRKFTVADIINYVPANFSLAVLVLMLLYAIKALSIFFPRVILYVSVGLLFAPLTAIVINLAGAAVCLSVAYLMGKISGKEAVLKLGAKYPKLEKLEVGANQNSFFSAFILRIVCFVPADLVSMFLGASGMAYGPFLIGSLLGWLPGLVFQTLIGTCLNGKPSPGMLVLFVAMLLLSLVISLVCNKKFKMKNNFI